MSDEVLDGFVTLFRGRGDCWGAWSGGCVREPLTKELFRDHLYGDTPIGVYPAIPLGTRTQCVWGCTDIDKEESPEKAIAIYEALAAVDVTSWIERSENGWHVWVFATQLVEAVHMRNMLLAAHQVAGVPAREVNPKQSHLSIGQVGNYVRLPYPKHLLGSSRVVMEFDGDGLGGPGGHLVPLSDFVSRALLWRETPQVIEHWASYYKPPPEPEHIIAAPSEDMAQAASRLPALGRIIFRDGPRPEGDRSLTLLRLAHHCHEAGLAPEDCLLLLEDADLRWGKFMIRGASGERELHKLVAKVYGVTPSS